MLAQPPRVGLRPVRRHLGVVQPVQLVADPAELVGGRAQLGGRHRRALGRRHRGRRPLPRQEPPVRLLGLRGVRGREVEVGRQRAGELGQQVQALALGQERHGGEAERLVLVRAALDQVPAAAFVGLAPVAVQHREAVPEIAPGRDGCPPGRPGGSRSPSPAATSPGGDRRGPRGPGPASPSRRRTTGASARRCSSAGRPSGGRVPGRPAARPDPGGGRRIDRRSPRTGAPSGPRCRSPPARPAAPRAAGGAPPSGGPGPGRRRPAAPAPWRRRSTPPTSRKRLLFGRPGRRGWLVCNAWMVSVDDPRRQCPALRGPVFHLEVQHETGPGPEAPRMGRLLVDRQHVVLVGLRAEGSQDAGASAAEAESPGPASWAVRVVLETGTGSASKPMRSLAAASTMASTRTSGPAPPAPTSPSRRRCPPGTGAAGRGPPCPEQRPRHLPFPLPRWPSGER